jgi:hypothetical protein
VRSRAPAGSATRRCPRTWSPAASSRRVTSLPGHVTVPGTTQLNNCSNPTYSNGVNHLIKDAPQPSPCDYRTASVSCTAVNGRAVAGSGSGGSGSGSGANPSALAAGTGSGAIDPDTGLPVGSSDGTGNGNLYAEPVAASARRGDWALGTFAAAELLAVVAVPTVLATRLRRRKRGAS